jgi:hypothetical protein
MIKNFGAFSEISIEYFLSEDIQGIDIHLVKGGRRDLVFSVHTIMD